MRIAGVELRAVSAHGKGADGDTRLAGGPARARARVSNAAVYHAASYVVGIPQALPERS